MAQITCSPLSLCQMADRLSLRRDMTYGAHRVHDSSGAQPRLPHPGESQGNRCGCQGIVLMNLDIIPTSAALVCGQIFYNFSSTFAFSNKTSFSLHLHLDLSQITGDLSFSTYFPYIQDGGTGGCYSLTFISSPHLFSLG